MTTRRFKDCRDPWIGVQIGANGDVAPCCHALQRMGNLMEENLDAIWSGARLRTFRALLASTTPLPVCASCFVRGWREEAVPLRRGFAVGARRLPRLLSGRLRAPRLKVWPDPPVHKPGESLSLNLSLVIGRLAGGPPVDLTLMLEDPSGGRHFVAYNGRWLKIVPEPTPLLEAAEPIDLEWLEVRGGPPREWPAGEWRCTAVLSAAGRDGGDEAARLASASCTFLEMEAMATATPDPGRG